MSEDYDFPPIKHSPTVLDFELRTQYDTSNLERKFDRYLSFGGLEDTAEASNLVSASWVKLLSTDVGVEIIETIFLGAGEPYDQVILSEFLPDFIEWLTNTDPEKDHYFKWERPNFRPAWSGVTAWEKTDWLPSGVGSATVFSETATPQILLSSNAGYRERIVSAQHSFADVIVYYAEKAGVELPRGDVAHLLVRSVNAGKLEPLESAFDVQKTIEVILENELVNAVPRYLAYV